jgi:hypothetical protein
MSTVYAINDPASLTALETSTADKVFLYDASAGVTKVGTLYDVAQHPGLVTASVSSNGAAISGSVQSIAAMGTSTSAVLSAPSRVGAMVAFTSGTSTVAYTVLASGSSFGTGTTWTMLGGGTITFAAPSTSRWHAIGKVANGSTDLA